MGKRAILGKTIEMAEYIYFLVARAGLDSTQKKPISCLQFIRHHGGLNIELDKARWNAKGFKCFKEIQRKGTMVVTWPGIYHSEILTGYTLNEGLNFSTQSWFNEGPLNVACGFHHENGSSLSEVYHDVGELVRKARGN
jgi:hypothetical protein